MTNDQLKTVYLALGSNLGDREEALKKAIYLINHHDQIEVIAVSSVYETEPANMDSDHLFLNQVIQIQTDLSPRELLVATQNIEKNIGRTEKGKNQDRIIDIDILLYGEEVIDEKDLKIPHPKIKERNFVFIPLLEITPNLKDPLTNKLYSDILDTLN